MAAIAACRVSAATPRRSLWRHPDFRALWASQTVSQLGSQVTFLALPLTAAVTLDASARDMALLGAAGTLPNLLFGLVAGVWVDRLPRRPIMIAADLARAALLGSLPVAALLGALTLAHLYAVAFWAGACSLAFDVAYRSYLPAIVDRAQLPDGNGKLELSRSAAEMAGPGLAGGLARLFTAPIAILADAASLLLSAACLGAVRAPEPPRAAATQRAAMRADIASGWRAIMRQPLLRALASSAAALQLCNAMLETVLLLYLARELRLGAGSIGVLFAIGNVGFLLGALVPARVVARVGIGPSIAGAIALAGVSDLLVPLAVGPRAIMLALLLLAQFGFGLGRTIYSVQQVSVRQQLTPDELLGRVNATMLFLTTGLAPLGALLGGVAGGVLGLRATLLLAAGGELLAGAWLALSPLGRTRAV